MVMRVFPLEGINAPRLALEKSYSALIGLNFTRCGATSRYQPDYLAAVRVNNHKQMASAPHAQGYESLFALGIRVGTMQCKSIHKYALCIRKRDAMLAKISRRLGRVKLKLHQRSICILCISRKSKI